MLIGRLSHEERDRERPKRSLPKLLVKGVGMEGKEKGETKPLYGAGPHGTVRSGSDVAAQDCFVLHLVGQLLILINIVCKS